MTDEIKRIFFCGVDSDKYYFKVNKITKNNKVMYTIDNSDCNVEEYETLNEAYKEMFNSLYHQVETYYEDYKDSHIIYNTYNIPKEYITKDIIKRMNDNDYLIVKFKYKDVLTNHQYLYYSIITQPIYNECKDKYKLIIVYKPPNN